MKDQNGTTDSQDLDVSFSTLTFNLRFGLAEDGENNWEHRKKALPALFKEFRPDFIGVQEAMDFQIDYLTELLIGYEYIGKRSPAPSYWQNNIIFFKNEWTLTMYRHRFLSRTPTVPSKLADSRWPRQCTIGMFNCGCNGLICINTHFDFAENVQTDSAVIILEQLAELPPDVPAVLLGDFNCTPQQKCHRVFTGESPKSSLGGPWFKNAATKPYPGTYHGFNGQADGEHIDWILYRGRIVPITYKVVTGTFEGIYPSDHYPVYAEFKWRAES